MTSSPLPGAPFLAYREGELFLEDVRLADLARQHGTPLFVYSKAAMLAALDAAPGRYDTSSLVTIVSSGVMWSREVKAGLIRHIPQVVLMDSFGASEGLGFGLSVTSAAGETATARFTIGGLCDVFDEHDRPVVPGSGTPGFIARKGAIPIGYYKDPEKSAKTYARNGALSAIAPQAFRRLGAR